MPDACAATTDTVTGNEKGDTSADPTDSESDHFPRSYVEKLRSENAGHRDRAKTAEARADELARALFTARVAATGKLADPTDLDFDADALDDDEKLAAAIESLTDAKPHLKARRPTGSIGQGERGDSTAEFSLLDRLKGND